MQNLLICGSGFSIGMGCLDLTNERFGALLAKQLGMAEINLSREGCSNYGIFLQILYAEQMPDSGVVIISPTTYDGIDWYAEQITRGRYNANDLYYAKAAPFHPGTHPSLAKRYLVGGALMSEKIGALAEYLERQNRNVLPDPYYDRFNSQPIKVLARMKDAYNMYHSTEIQRHTDVALFASVHCLLRQRKLKHVFLVNDALYRDFIDDEYLLHVDEEALAHTYPDEMLWPWRGFINRGRYASYIAHRQVFEAVAAKLKETT